MIDHRGFRPLAGAECFGDGGQHRCGVARSLEANEARPVLTLGDAGNLDGEAGLSDARWPDQGHQAFIDRESADSIEVGVAACHR